MNSDIRIAVTFIDHLKTVKLQRRLGAESVLCLIRLWCYTAQNRPDGVLSGMDKEDIEIASKWSGDAGEFVKALVDIGWLVEGAGYALNDWEDHQPYVVHAPQRRERAKRAASAKYAKRLQQASVELPCGKQDVSLDDAPSPAPFPSPTPSPVPSPTDIAETSSAFITIPTNKGEEFTIYENQCAEWENLFPAVNVRQELREMRAWSLANQRNRKTSSGMLRFVTSWLGRSQDKSGKTGPVVKFGKPTIVDYRRNLEDKMK